MSRGSPTCAVCAEIPEFGRRRRCRWCKELVCSLCITTTAPDLGGPSCRTCDWPDRQCGYKPYTSNNPLKDRSRLK